MTTCTVFREVEGNTGPGLVVTESFDLSAMVGVSATIRYESGGELNKDVVIDDAATGAFHVEWEATDLVAGVHQVEFIFNAGSSGVTRLPADKPYVLIVRPQA